MGAYYAYNTGNGYKVDTHSWYKIFEHMSPECGRALHKIRFKKKAV